jgi:mycofactocin precursor
MQDINLPMPINEAIAPGQATDAEEILGTRAMSLLDSLPAGGPTPPLPAPALNDICHPKRVIGTAPIPVGAGPESTLEAEIEEELIIEDFTIDGICGVY